MCSISPVAARSLDWRVYVDADHNCRLEYPRAIFSPSDPEDDEPQRFTAWSGDVYFRVMAADNAALWTPADIKARYISSDVPGRITYQRTTGAFVVLSGYRGGDIFYTKVALSPDRQRACILEIVYQQQHKERLDAVVTRMSRSFTARG
jgi:hypothetical protein